MYGSPVLNISLIQLLMHTLAPTHISFVRSVYLATFIIWRIGVRYRNDVDI